jgi:hypothetical protein
MWAGSSSAVGSVGRVAAASRQSRRSLALSDLVQSSIRGDPEAALLW